MEQFFKNIVATQDKIQTTPGKRFWIAHGGAALTASLLTGHAGGGAAYSAGMIGYLLSAQQLGKLLANQKTGRLMVRLAGGEALDKSEEWAARMFVNALNGTTISAINADGTTRPVQVKDGKLIPED